MPRRGSGGRFTDSSTTAMSAFRTLAQDAFYGGPAAPPPPPPPPPTTSEVRYVASASSNANKTNHTVQVPATVQVGDTLLLFFTANLNPTTTTAPQGWTAVSSADPSGLRARLWTRTATASDVGSTLTVDNSAYTKADLKIVAYRGTGAVPLDVHAVAVDTVTTTQHTAPSVTPTQNDTHVLVYWADKSSTNTTHTVPASLTKLTATTTGSGGGRITATIAAMAAGPAGTPTGTFLATGTGAANRAVMHTIALRP